ncbi:hypothetical protein WH8501_11660 [Crocosphaera watsonii WH 8501]|uniref:hypothetical protein n=1 Tax=Crocosphaera watsonii TaxID=263511 RepID=UPI0005B2554E|nr:hypothetical protein [Crocosphaera watsonii]
MGKSAIALFKPTSCKASVFGDRRFCEKFGKRITVRSTEELSQKILNFIDYFNQHFAKPFVWKFKGFKDHK